MSVSAVLRYKTQDQVNDYVFGLSTVFDSHSRNTFQSYIHLLAMNLHLLALLNKLLQIF